MSVSERRQQVHLLLEEAAYRLTGAVEHAPREGQDARMACENAHDAIEVSLNAVIVARGEKYRSSHDLSQLADVAAHAGEPIPAELNGIRELRPYTGGGRYSYRAEGRIEAATQGDYDQIVNLAKMTYAWAGGRARELCGARPPRPITPDGETATYPEPEPKPLQPGGDPGIKPPPPRGRHGGGVAPRPAPGRSPLDESSGPKR